MKTFAWFGKLALLGASLVFCLLLAELGLRLFFKGPLCTDSLIVNDPEIAFVLRKGVECFGISPEFTVRYCTDREVGLRTKHPDYSLSASPDVVVYGDSFVFGQGVEFDALFTTRLAQLFPGRKIVNAGVFNYGPDQSFLLARRWRNRFASPIELLVVYTGNDFRDITRYGIVQRDETGIRLVPPNDPHGETRRRLTNLPFYRQLCRVRLWHLFRLAILQRNASPAPQENGPMNGGEVAPASGKSGQTMADLLAVWQREIGDNLMVAIVHDRGRSMLDSPDMVRLREGLDANRINWKDFSAPELDASSFARLYYVKDGHWNPDGHQWIAEQVAPWLQSAFER